MDCQVDQRLFTPVHCLRHHQFNSSTTEQLVAVVAVAVVLILLFK
jgi:hypothetical protein